MLRPEFVCSLCILSKGSEVYNYVVVDRVIRCTCYLYQHILHVPGMNVFTHSFYVTIQVYDYDEIRICLFILLYLYYMQCTCICKIKCVITTTFMYNKQMDKNKLFETSACKYHNPSE
jgi:hypothetical protein